MKVWIICNYEPGAPEDHEVEKVYETEEDAKNYLRLSILKYEEIGCITKISKLLESTYDELMNASGYYYNSFDLLNCKVDWAEKAKKQEAELKIEQDKALKKLEQAVKKSEKKDSAKSVALKKLTKEDRKALGIS